MNGSEVTVTQETEYPWDDTVEISVSTEEPVKMALRPRIPEWCSDPTVTVNGEPVSSDIEKGHAEIRRIWEDGDKLTVQFPMPVTQIEAHPNLTAAAGRMALQRGPVVYCFEGVDNEVPLENVCFPTDAEFDVKYDSTSLGVVVIHGEATVTETGHSEDALYRPRTETAEETARMTAVPYYAWANREQTEMRVWMRACDCTH